MCKVELTDVSLDIVTEKKQMIKSQFFWVAFLRGNNWLLSQRSNGCGLKCTFTAQKRVQLHNTWAHRLELLQPIYAGASDVIYYTFQTRSVEQHCHRQQGRQCCREFQPVAHCTVSRTHTELCISAPPSSVQSPTDGNPADPGPYCPERIPHGHTSHTHSEKRERRYVGAAWLKLNGTE